MSVQFLLVAAAMVAFAMLIVLGRRGRGAGDGGADAARAQQLNAAVLRDRMAELAREHDRGLLGSDEFAAAQDELQRRVLAEAAAAEAPAAAAAPLAATAAAARARTPLVAAALALLVGALALYLVLGSPHLLALVTAAVPAATASATDGVAPQANGSGPGDNSAASVAPIVQLEAHVAVTPKDARAWVMLARARMEAGQFAPAAAAYQRALDAQPRVARDPQVWCEYADALGMSQGGTLAGRPRELIERALAADAGAPCALEMAGSAAIEARDFKTARVHWQRLLAQLPQGSTQHAQLTAALDRVEQQARFALPPAQRAPAAR